MSEKQTCVVCLSTRRKFRFLKLLPCEHSNVCYDCITKLQTPCCPSCRTEVRLIVLNNGTERSMQAIEYEMRARDEQAHAATLQVVFLGEHGSGAQPLADLLVNEMYRMDSVDSQAAAAYTRAPGRSEQSLNEEAHPSTQRLAAAASNGHNVSGADDSFGRWHRLSHRRGARDSRSNLQGQAQNRLRELEKAKMRAALANSNHTVNIDPMGRETVFEDIRVSEFNGVDKTTDSEMVVWGAQSRFSPNMIAHGVPIRLTLLHNVREPSYADVKGVLEDLLSLKPDVLVMCCSYHDRQNFSSMISWDRLIREKHPNLSRLWNLVQRPGFDALNAGGVDIRTDIPCAIQEITDQHLRPKAGYFITAPQAHVFKLDLRKFVETMLCHGSKRPGFINGAYKPRTFGDRVRGWMSTIIERSTEDPITMDAAERMRTGSERNRIYG